MDFTHWTCEFFVLHLFCKNLEISLFKAQQVSQSGKSLTSSPKVEGCDLTSKRSNAAEHEEIRRKFTEVHRMDLFPLTNKSGLF